MNFHETGPQVTEMRSSSKESSALDRHFYVGEGYGWLDKREAHSAA